MIFLEMKGVSDFLNHEASPSSLVEHITPVLLLFFLSSSPGPTVAGPMLERGGTPRALC
jgi:hypothetical protein